MKLLGKALYEARPPQPPIWSCTALLGLYVVLLFCDMTWVISGTPFILEIRKLKTQEAWAQRERSGFSAYQAAGLTGRGTGSDGIGPCWDCRLREKVPEDWVFQWGLLCVRRSCWSHEQWDLQSNGIKRWHDTVRQLQKSLSRLCLWEGRELCQDTEKTIVSKFLAKWNIFFSRREIIIKRILWVWLVAGIIHLEEKRGHF